MSTSPTAAYRGPETSAAQAARGDADLAAIGALLADPGRCRMLLALDDGRALPASTLAAEAGVSASTASSHLGRLTAAGLLRVEVHGRHRYYRLAGPEVGRLLETVAQLAPAVPVRSLRQGTKAQALRAARTCYDHLAGRLGVQVLASMIDRGHLEGGDGRFDAERDSHDRLSSYGREVDYVLTSQGWEFLDDWDVRLAPRRRVVRYCVDWTEQRHHLSGALGRALLDRVISSDWVRASQRSRAVVVTSDGREGLMSMFGAGVLD